MTAAQVRRRGAYAPLAATYFTDDDVMEAGEEAELLYVRGLAFCAGNPASDGYITDKQVTRVVGAGMDELPMRIKSLVAVGLWERLPGGYAIRSWLKWNKSAEELGRFRARDRDRKSAKTDMEEGAEGHPEGAEFREDSTDVPRGNETESDPGSGDQSIWIPNTNDLDSKPLYTTQHNTTQQSENPPSSPAAPATETEALDDEDAHEDDEAEEGDDEGADEGGEPKKPRARSWDNIDLNTDPDFCAFWDAYPRKVDKGHARKAWISVMKKGGVEPAAIIAGAVAYRNDPQRKPDITFTAHASTWLNGERWTDYDETDSVAVTDPDEWWNN